MLSFYEMDRLLQKNNKQQKKYNESLSDVLRQKAMALAAKLKGGATPTAAQTPAPQATPVAPAMTPTAKPVTAIQPDAGSQNPDDIINSLIAGMGGKKAQKVGGAEVPQKPAVLTNQKHDPHENMPRREFKRLGDKESTIIFWNKLLKSGNEIGDINPETGMHGKVSTWSWALLNALKSMGAKIDPSLKDGDTFQLAFAQGQSGQQDMPEVVVDPNMLERASRKVWAQLGNDRLEDDRISNVPKINSFSGALMHGLVKGGTPEEQEASLQKVKTNLLGQPNPEISKRIRAADFEKMIRHHSIAGKEMTVMQLAHELGKQTLNGGLEQSDPKLDLDALVHMIKTDKMGKYHVFAIPKGPLTVDTMIRVNSPNELGKSEDPLLSATPVGSPDFAKGNAGEDDRTIGQLDANNKRRRTIASKRIGGTPQAESNHWMDVQESLEHWGW